MRKELDDLLCQHYPDLFRDRHLDASESCMAKGFECGDGWFDLIDTLCHLIASKVKEGSMPPVVVRQVKEKFGSLRFYFRGGNEETYELRRAAEEQSARTCELCGKPGEISSATRSICCLCPGHAAEDRMSPTFQGTITKKE